MGLPATIGPYRLVRRLGEGGMGAVFEARDDKTGRSVALKILLPEYGRDRNLTQRLFREARALGRIRHPGIVEVYESGQQSDGMAYVAMELLKGQTLADWHKEHAGPVPVPLVLQLGKQISEALAAAQQQGIVHRDVKPSNIMLLEAGAEPRIKLLDFGLAKLAQDSSSQKAKTASDVIMGTPYYMSPEQCEGAVHAGPQSDVYSLGVVLFELIAGRLPFDAQGSGQLLVMHMAQEAPHLRKVMPGVPVGLCDLIHTLLAKQGEQRPKMGELAEELSRMLREGGMPRASPLAQTYMHMAVRPRTGLDTSFAWSRGQSFLSKHPRVLIGVGLALGLIAILFFNIFKKDRAPQPTPAAKPLPIASPPVASAPAPLPVRWILTSAPANALVVRLADGRVLGKTPWTYEQQPAKGSVSLSVRLPGYADEPVTFERDLSRNVHLPLHPRAGLPRGSQGTSSRTPAKSNTPKGTAKPPAKPGAEFNFGK